jgi:glyoxylase-like metal-dependent hydrolase (beta-lactamase superfamily II)
MFSHLKAGVTELAPGFYRICGPNKSRFPHCNTFLLTGQETVLIDAGLDKETLLEIDRIKRIDILIISHSHPDHILNWAFLKDRHLVFPFETPESVYDLTTFGKRFMGTEKKGKIWAEIVGTHLGMKALRAPEQRFKDGEILSFAGFKLLAIHGPGHLDDHYCFFELNTGILLTSDIDFSGFGPFYGQPECNILQFKKTIKKVMQQPYKLLCYSHKNPIYGDAADEFKKFLKGFDRHGRLILNICKTPHTLDQITEKSPLYLDKMPVKIFQETFERGMISKSIDLMVKEGVMSETPDGFVKKSG